MRCDHCSKETDKPSLIVVRIWGGGAAYIYLCSDCSGLYIRKLTDLVTNSPSARAKAKSTKN